MMLHHLEKNQQEAKIKKEKQIEQTVELTMYDKILSFSPLVGVESRGQEKNFVIHNSFIGSLSRPA